MSTRISSLSMRTIGAFDHVAVLEALDVGVLLGEQLLHRRGLGAGRALRGDGGQLVLGLDVGRGRRVGRVVVRGRCRRPRRRCRLGGASAGLGLDGLGGRRPRRPRLDGLARRRGLGLGDLGGRRLGVGVGRLGGLGRAASASVPRRGPLGAAPPRRSAVASVVLRLGAGLGGGGLVGDGDGRDGLLGRRGIAGGCRLRRRRGPALLLVGQGDPVSFMDSALGITNGRRAAPGAVLEREGDRW